MNVELVVVGGMKTGMEIPVSTPKFLIGRGNNCHIRPQSVLIGNLHCIITVGEHSVTLEDCGEAIGTFVNGKRIKFWQNLKNGDRIKIAALEFEVRISADEAVAKKSPAPIAHAAVHHAVTSAEADEGDAKIVQWVEPEDKSTSSPPQVVTFQQARPVEALKQTAGATAALTVTDEFGKHGFDWEWIDKLLLSAIVLMVVLVLLNSLPTDWFWQGVGGFILAALGAVVIRRIRRPSGEIFDGMNIIVGILAVVVVSFMVPKDTESALLKWAYNGGTFLGLVGLSWALIQRAESELDEKNLALLAAIGLLIFSLISPLLPFSLWTNLVEAGILLAAAIFYLGHCLPRMTGYKSDKVMLFLATICIVALVILGYLFPITSWWPNWLNLGTPRDVWAAWIRYWCLLRDLWYNVLGNLWYYWRVKWGLVVSLAAVLVVLVWIRVRQKA